jgi:hypothetical protein
MQAPVITRRGNADRWPPRRPSTWSGKGRHAAGPISRPPLHHCPDRRIRKAMVTLAWAAQLHYHDFAACPCGPRKNSLNNIEVILRKCGRGLSLCPATTLDNTLTGGALSGPTSRHLLKALPYAHHSTFQRARGALAIRLEFPRARCSRCKLY